MDLALHLGMTAGGLKRSMTESEFQEWQRYAARRMLPWRRMELLLAQIAKWIAVSMGGVKNATLQDYLFDPPDRVGVVDEDEEPTAEDVAAFFKATLVKSEKG